MAKRGTVDPLNNGPDNPGDPDERPMKRCPECGTMLRIGDKRCDFCGRKVAPDPPVKAPGRGARKAGRFSPLELAKAVGVLCLIVGTVVVVRKNTAERSQPAPPREIHQDVKQQAYKVCEEHLRRHPPSTFSVSSIGSALVAAEKDGFVVTGTAELQDPAGAAVRRRFSCTVLPDARSGMTVGEAKFL